MAVRTPELTYPKHVSEDADLVARALGTASHVFLFLDYDGTLVFSGEEVGGPPRDVTECLSELCGSASVSVFVMSSRSVEELGSVLDVPGLSLVGQGGLEIRRWNEPVVYPVDPEVCGSLIQRLELESHRLFGGAPDIRIENRGFSVTLAGPGILSSGRRDAADRFARLVKTLDAGKRLELLYAGGTVEARLAGWHKGDAVRHILREADPDESLVIYVGDDVTDEDAFRAVDEWCREAEPEGSWYAPQDEDEDEEGRRGITVLVSRSPRPTSALLFVRDTDEVREFISSLAAVAAAIL